MVEDLIVMLAPFAPHFAEENWERLGHDGSIFDARWPTWDERLTVEDTVEIAVQVSGKTRSRVTVPRGADEAAVVAAAQEDAAVRRFTEGKEVRKVVYVPNRLLNLVVVFFNLFNGEPLSRRLYSDPGRLRAVRHVLEIHATPESHKRSKMVSPAAVRPVGSRELEPSSAARNRSVGSSMPVHAAGSGPGTSVA